MNNEENIQQKLIAKFNYLDGKIKIPRVRRISAEVSQSNFFDVFGFLVQELKFTHLCAITGLDEGQFLSFIYHITTENGIVINLKTSVPKENSIIKTVMPYFPCAEVYEREVIDLLGAVVDSLPPGGRYPLPDNWPRNEFPLRKDWKPKVEVKENR
ncbi:MAG: NADH-quinone oxidoreductase subunit C [Candidatus Omnitrophota bacterium]|jgi:Ni,Fe-hydrogenase III component G